MENWEQVLSQLSDPEAFEVEAGQVVYRRMGLDHSLQLAHQPAFGLAVESYDDKKLSNPEPISVFIQKNVLDLGTFAKQIARTLELRSPGKTIPYIEVSANFVDERQKSTDWIDNASQRLLDLVPRAEPGVTRVIQLMAPAGQGKTALLENLALKLARAYFPADSPTPLLLPVDLLGRYVGTMDDAIAGSLNNFYRYPLPQKDVIQIMKCRWLVLALDGFDELVARTSLREAFFRLSDLLDQLEGSGTIILSARQSFFDLWRITTAIRTYLQPKRGAYQTYSVNLLPWQETQAKVVFSHVGSGNPADDIVNLGDVFGGDIEMLFNPFLLIKVAELWAAGERFASASEASDTLHRIAYILRVFLAREANVKWQDAEGRQILPIESHYDILSSVAEEMWKSNAMYLDIDELKLSTELGLSQKQFSRELVNSALDRIGTHAAFALRDGKFRFVHDQFFNFFLGRRIADIIEAKNIPELLEVLGKAELQAVAGEWVLFFLLDRKITVAVVAGDISKIVLDRDGDYESFNIAMLLALFLNGQGPVIGVTVRNLTFAGSVLEHCNISSVTFSSCRFVEADLASALLEHCEFIDCEFVSVHLDRHTSLRGSKLHNCSLSGLSIDQGGVYSPEEIKTVLTNAGAQIVAIANVENAIDRRIDREIIRCVELFVRRATVNSVVVVEDITELYSRFAPQVAKVALDSQVARLVPKGTGGPKKTFLKFIVDKSKLMSGLTEPSGDQAIEGFWRAIGKKYSR